jgi:hypothetical protein
MLTYMICTHFTAPEPLAPVDKLAKTAMYPPIQPYDKGMLKVSGIHTIAYSLYGNPTGM